MLLVRCSEIENIVANPKAHKDVHEKFKTPEYKQACNARNPSNAQLELIKHAKHYSLSKGAKTYVRKKVEEYIKGITYQFENRPCTKGTICEDESIKLLREYFFDNGIKKNTERKSNDFITGECDIIRDNQIMDVKTPFKYQSMPFFEEDADDYVWQLRGYMWLWQKPSACLAYCAVDTPEDLIYGDDRSQHIVSHLPIDNRVSIFHKVERDERIERFLMVKIKACQEYFEEKLAEQLSKGRQLHRMEKTA